MSSLAFMRTEGEKKSSIMMAPFLLSPNQAGKPEAVHEEQRSHDDANKTRVNGITSTVFPVWHDQAQADSAPTELEAPDRTSNGASERAAIFPYIPRKRQERSGLLIDYLYFPALEAAGDQVDFLMLGENRVGVLLADISGTAGQENLPVTKTALRSHSTGLSTAATLRYLDEHLSEICTNGYAITAFYSIFDQNKRLLHFASAGHLPMLIYRPATGKVFLLNTAGSPLGVHVNGRDAANDSPAPSPQRLPESAPGTLGSSISALKSERVALRQNDLLVLYSGGLLSARNSQGEYWGRQRLVDFVRKHGDLDPTLFLVELKRVLEKFTNGQSLTDDITVVVLKNVLRDLDKPHPEAEGCELEKSFLSTDEEQPILEILRENPNANLQEILDGLASGAYSYLSRDQVQTYLAQLGHWLRPVKDRNGKSESGLATAVTAAEENRRTKLSVRKQFHQDILAAFPIRQLLHKRYEFRGSSSEIAQALSYYNHGDYERALAEFTRLRPLLKSSASVHCFFGNLHLLLSAPAKAQHEYLMALKLDPRCVLALLGLSYIALLQEDYQTAIDSIFTALRFDKNLTVYQKFAEKLIAAVERLENRNEWIV